MTTDTETDNVQQLKARNNDWWCDSTYWGVDFVATVETEGNEALGEKQHVTTERALEQHLIRDDTPFDGDGRPRDSEDVETPVSESRSWSMPGVDLEFTLAGSESIVAAGFDAAADVVAESLHGGWEEVDHE